MSVDLILNNTKAYVKNEIVNCSLAIDHGKILKIGKGTAMPKAVEKTNLEGLLVLPGLIDAHVHLRDEGKAYKEDFCSGTAAAAAGGFTTVLDMPNNSPVTMSAETLRNRMKVAETKALVNVGFYSEFPRDMEEIGGIVDEGAIAFKLFMTKQVGGLNINDDDTMMKAFEILSSLGAPVAVHAEDSQTLLEAEGALKSRGHDDVEAFLAAHSENVEVKAIRRLLKIAKQINIHLHFCHVSTEGGLKAIHDARIFSTSITCETTPHNLLLTVDDLKKIGALALTMPPVREESHTKALWDGLKNGWIDILASDHAPHTLEEKQGRNIWKVKVGIPGLETTLPLLLTRVNKGQLSIADLVRLMSARPAEIFRLNGKGCIAEGKCADLTVVDLDTKYRIDSSRFHSKAKYSPFNGWQVQGKAIKTFVNGQLIMDGGEIIARPGSGETIRGS